MALKLQSFKPCKNIHASETSKWPKMITQMEVTLYPWQRGVKTPEKGHERKNLGGAILFLHRRWKIPYVQ